MCLNWTTRAPKWFRDFIVIRGEFAITLKIKHTLAGGRSIAASAVKLTSDWASKLLNYSPNADNVALSINICNYRGKLFENVFRVLVFELNCWNFCCQLMLLLLLLDWSKIDITNICGNIKAEQRFQNESHRHHTQASKFVKCRGKSTLPHIKTSIFNAYGLFANFYKLYYKGTELDDDVTPLKDLGITDGSFINLIRWNEPAGTPQFFKLDTDSWTIVNEDNQTASP